MSSVRSGLSGHATRAGTSSSTPNRTPFRLGCDCCTISALHSAIATECSPSTWSPHCGRSRIAVVGSLGQAVGSGSASKGTQAVRGAAPTLVRIGDGTSEGVPGSTATMDSRRRGTDTFLMHRSETRVTAGDIAGQRVTPQFGSRDSRDMSRRSRDSRDAAVTTEIAYEQALFDNVTAVTAVTPTDGTTEGAPFEEQPGSAKGRLCPCGRAGPVHAETGLCYWCEVKASKAPGAR